MVAVSFLTYSINGGGAESVLKTLKHTDDFFSNVFIIDELKYNKNKLKIITFFLSIYYYRRYLLKNKINVSFSILYYESFINLLSCFGLEIKKIISIHSVPSKKIPFYNNTIFKFYFALFLNQFDQIHTVSNNIKFELINYYNIVPSKITVIYNPIDIKYIRRKKNEPILDEWYDPNKKYLINVGRLIIEKGQYTLIRIMTVLKNYGFNLIICGDGKLYKELINLVNKYELVDFIHFTGWTNNPYKYIGKSLMYISTSIYEALPVSIIESLACGTPVVATNCKYGPKEIIGNSKYGILTPNISSNNQNYFTKNEKKLLKEIISLYANTECYNHYVKKAIYRSKYFNKKNISNKYIDLINYVYYK